MNLLDGYKDSIEGAMKNIFDSFKRKDPLTFYKMSEEQITILDPSFNADLQEFDYLNTNLVEQSKQFYCRVIFPKRESNFHNSIPNITMGIKAEQDFSEISIQMEQDAYEYVKDTVRFSYLGENYQKMSPIRKIGFLDTFYLYELYLKKVN